MGQTLRADVFIKTRTGIRELFRAGHKTNSIAYIFTHVRISITITFTISELLALQMSQKVKVFLVPTIRVGRYCRLQLGGNNLQDSRGQEQQKQPQLQREGAT